MTYDCNLDSLNIPKTDIECWERYPKYHWVYDLSRLLDIQNIQWSPYVTETLRTYNDNIVLTTATDCIKNGHIYTEEFKNTPQITEIFVSRGDIKRMHGFDTHTRAITENVSGDVELRLTAFTVLHMSKFTGAITYTTHGPVIYRVILRPVSVWENTDISLVKIAKRIYKKS